jgi:hypothetical protein
VKGKIKFLVAAAAWALIIASTSLGCNTTGTTTTPTVTKPGGGLVVNSDSIVTVKIQGITAQSAGYPWKLEVLVQITQDVGALPNPVRDSVGKVVTVFTDENMAVYKVGDVVTAKTKYVGDVYTPAGISLYMYDVGIK